MDSAPDPSAGRRFGLRADFQYGQATETVQGNPVNEPRPDVYRQIWQAYGSYVFPVGRGLQMDFGKFASNLGYETNYAKDNVNFSRAYLFNFLPFYHMGLRTALPLSDTVTTGRHVAILWFDGQLIADAFALQDNTGGVLSILIVKVDVARLPATSLASPRNVWMPSVVMVHEAVAARAPGFTGAVPIDAGQIARRLCSPESRC